MPCFRPNTAWYLPQTRTVSFEDRFGKEIPGVRNSIQLACGQCTGCRSEYSRQWAMRIVLEQSLWLNNIFITLTYDNDNIPEHNTLIKKDFQDFMKRLRWNKQSTKENPVRFFHCGEYGDKFGRPHYHAILFNTNFSDRKQLQGHKGLTTSETLSKLWGKGHSSIGDVTFQSAAYVAGYVQKKINGKQKDSHYAIIDDETGQYFGQRQQEYSTMSRNPGIAGNWLAQYKDDVYPSDNIHINGKEMKPPKSFDRLYEIDHKDEMLTIKDKRMEEAENYAYLRTPEALRQAEKTHKARMSLYKRGKL
jgi:hypothetical protein